MVLRVFSYILAGLAVGMLFSMFAIWIILLPEKTQAQMFRDFWYMWVAGMTMAAGALYLFYEGER